MKEKKKRKEEERKEGRVRKGRELRAGDKWPKSSVLNMGRGRNATRD